nr:piggyBac transposable element-derived protein 4-like [Onthophagus taurus]
MTGQNSDSEEELHDDDADTSSEEYIEDTEHDSESEIEGNDSDDLEDVGNSSYFIAKDKLTRWSKNSLKSKFSKVSAKNLVKIFPGAKQQARDIQNEVDAFMRIFTDEMIQYITECTNLHISNVRSQFMRERDAKDVSKTEMQAFMGLLLLSGYKKQNHTHFLELWTTDGTGSEIFRMGMGKNSFLFLLAVIRFDDKSTRNQRKKIDKLAAIRWVIDKFIENCKNNYSVGNFLTIDEMLIPFRGRCSFLQYIPNKPAKYGMKVFVLCDAKTFYVSNFEVYCGKQPEGFTAC